MSISNGTRVNNLLRQERIRRNWRQRDLAEHLGTTVVTVKRWERGYQQPSSYFRVKLCTLFSKNAEELGFASEEVSEEAPAWHIPFPRNPFFTGRDSMLDQLHTVLTSTARVRSTPGQSYALHGLGGIGKTQLAIEYAYRYRYAYRAIFWVEAETLTSLTASFVRIAALLGLAEDIEGEQSKIVTSALRWLNQHEEWLLIFDNVEDLALLKPFLPSNDQGAILLTTRLQTLGTLAQRIELPPMNMQEGSDFLLVRTNRKKQTTIDQQEYAAIQTIITEMGGLPLALEQAGAYIDATQCSLSDYLQLFQEMQHRLLDEHESSNDHPLSVNRTFLLAFKQVEQRNPLAADLLTSCAFLAPEAIPDMFFLENASSLGSTFEAIAGDPLAFPEAIKVLLSYSLIQRSISSRTITVHRLVQVVLKARLTEAEQHAWGQRVINAIARIFPTDEATQANYLSMGEQLITHAQTCLHLADQWNDDEAQHVSLMSHVAEYLSKRGRFIEAEPLFERAVQMGERVLGAGHLIVAEALYGLASLYQEQGKFMEAEQLTVRALEIRRQALGPEHPLVATSLNMVGYCYYRLAKYKQAEDCYKQALHIRERTVEPEHPDIASSFYNLGTLYWRQGTYEQAEPLLKRALHIWEQALGFEHPQAAFPLRSLGVLYSAQGKYKQAEAYSQRALHIWEQALGADHPRVALSLNNLGTLYHEQGKYEQAEEYYQRAFHTWEQALGSQHPDTAIALNNLAGIYYKQGKYEQAEEYYRRTLHLWEQTLGAKYLDLAYPYHGLADLYRDQGKYEQAQEFYHRALTNFRRLSPQHPAIAETLHDLAYCHQLQQEITEAISLYQEALAIREQVYGSDHPKTEETKCAITQLQTLCTI